MFMKEKQTKQVINYYEVLGIPSNATLEQINKAFKRLSVTSHPDKLTITDAKKKESAETRYKTIVEAHNVLKDANKKANHDRLLARSEQNNTTPTEISGLLTTYLLPLSDHYKEIHSKVAMQTIIKPTRKEVSMSFIPVIAEGETSDFFVELKRRPESKDSLELPPFKDDLTPAYAFSLFEDFLKGKYYGEDYIRLKNYFEGALLALGRSENNKLTVELYEGFLSLIQIVEQDGKRKDIHASINKIIWYARYKEPTQMIKPVEKLAELFQNPVFRALYSAGMQQQWQTPFEVDFNLFFESQLDKTLEADTTGQKDAYLHTLYFAQEDLYQKYQTLKQEAEGTLGASEWRTLAFYCLDYSSVVSANIQVHINQLLQVCFFLRQAVQLEKDPQLQFADEKMISKTCLTIKSIGEHNRLHIDSYAHHYALCLLSTLNFKHLEVPKFIEHFKERMLKLAGFFPWYEGLQSNLDLIHNTITQVNYTREYLQTLVKWLKEKKKSLAFKETTILNAAYEASLNGIIPFDEKTEAKLRRKLMKATLAEKGASFLDISKNIHSDWVMMNMDPEGWLQPDLPLSFAKSLQTYQSLEGIEIDLNHGSIRFALKPWTPQDPAYKRVFSDCDLMQLFKQGDCVFSLEQYTAEYRHHPLQEMICEPPSLRNTEFFSTLFFTDYLLKFLTIGSEVQGQYPYELRHVQSLIEKLPLALQEQIIHFQSQKNIGKPHRFWIEASVIPTLKEEEGGRIRWTFGDIRMVIKKHGMEYDASGGLVDSDEAEEGWPIYRVKKIEDFEKERQGKHYLFRALVFIKNTNEVYCFDEQTRCKRAQIVLPNELQEEWDIQIFSIKGLLRRDKKIIEYDNSHFIYKLTNYVCEQINKPTHFSDERVIAESLTEHYDALAQCWPEFERLKQLSKVIGAVKEMQDYYREIKNVDNTYNEKQSEFSELYQKIQTAYNACVANEIDKLSVLLKGKDLTNTKNVASYRQQLIMMFPEICDLLGGVEFVNRIDQLLNGKAEPLAKAIGEYRKNEAIENFKKELAARYPGVPELFIIAALNGNTHELAEAVSRQSINQPTHNIKMEARLKLQAQFKALGFGVLQEPSSESTLNLVPAISNHQVNSKGSRLVYGGVSIRPSLTCQIEAEQHSRRLQMPSSSAFSRASDIRNAEAFVSDLRVSASRFSPLQVYTSSIDHMISDLERKINTARFDSFMHRPASVSAPPPDYGFRHTALPNLPLFEVLNEGIVGKAQYKTFKSDSMQCAVNKSEINELYKQVYSGDNPIEVPRLARYIARLEALTQDITESCKPATPEDLREMSLDDKSFLHMNAQELRTYILNQFEKFRGKSGPKVNYPHIFYKMQATEDRQTQAKLAEKQVELARQAEEQRQLEAKRKAQEQSDRTQEKSRKLDQNPISAAASLFSQGLKIKDPIVSHVTDAASVRSIMVDGIQLRSNEFNYYGGKAFYVAEQGYAVGARTNTHLILLARPADMKIYQQIASDMSLSGASMAERLRGQGIDAIQYHGSSLKPNGSDALNFAIINNQDKLKPLGVYRVVGDGPISTTPTRILQALGIAGTGVAVVYSAKQVIDSETPLATAAHIAAEFWASYKGGAAAADAALLPCSDLGMFAPQAAPVIVPVCIAGAAIVGGVAADMGLNLTLEVLLGHLKTTTLLHERNVKYMESLEQDRVAKKAHK